jgi:hypothetical protein
VKRLPRVLRPVTTDIISSCLTELVAIALHLMVSRFHRKVLLRVHCSAGVASENKKR